MTVLEAIQNRRSVRTYQPDPVPDEKLNKILEAARLAPSAHNAQARKFVVVRDAEQRRKLAGAAGQSFIAQAPVIIVAVSLDPGHILSSGVPAGPVDLAIAVDHMTLAAVAEGLGSCWVGAFSQEAVKEILNIPQQYQVIVLLPLGFPAQKPLPKSRKELKEIICRDTFSLSNVL